MIGEHVVSAMFHCILGMVMKFGLWAGLIYYLIRHVGSLISDLRDSK